MEEENPEISALKSSINEIIDEKSSSLQKLKELKPDMDEMINEKDGMELNELVKSVNTHHHTKSCRKYGSECR